MVNWSQTIERLQDGSHKTSWKAKQRQRYKEGYPPKKLISSLRNNLFDQDPRDE